MQFLDLKFPENISYGSSGGPEFSTDIVTGYNKRELRKINWMLPRARYNIAYSAKSSEEMLRLKTLFYLARGRALPFRFKDWNDYQSANEIIGFGDGKTDEFQLIKTYYYEGQSYIRKITRPTQNSVSITLDGVKASEYKIEYDTGIINFPTPPIKDQIISATFEFDIPVRFDNDTLLFTQDEYGSASCQNITLVEVLM